eukprot:922568-Rhodomonas_salina.1
MFWQLLAVVVAPQALLPGLSNACMQPSEAVRGTQKACGGVPEHGRVLQRRHSNRRRDDRKPARFLRHVR